MSNILFANYDFSRAGSTSPVARRNLGSSMPGGFDDVSPFSSPNSSFTDAPTRSKQLGYLAFPTGLSTPVPKASGSQEKSDETQKPTSQPLPAPAPPQALPSGSPERTARVSREQAEATRGEEEWVRNGGILRDANGKRDFQRTEAVREELRLREVEKALRERWEAYERRWKEMAGAVRQESIRFEDIPWPVALPEDESSKFRGYYSKKDTKSPRKVMLSNITTKNVEEFILGGLRIRGQTVTKKERIRASLLRWHPDKLTGLLSKVVEEDQDAVRDGIGIVVQCLHELNR
ncbi:hypothetical protein Moror_5731 [Moniliophthora roreri MCA 2997]|uniref:Uncharacterized protein n=1 Tax=Moniliophthora roreri (strain MCA 2997) TaxID=1381753 RepID=V2X0H4_MONRO|nr:hypothetical protein Moror_5731 [Moniliophthora roreri MCA 2997]